MKIVEKSPHIVVDCFVGEMMMLCSWYFVCVCSLWLRRLGRLFQERNNVDIEFELIENHLYLRSYGLVPYIPDHLT